MADILKFPFGKQRSEPQPESKPTMTEQNDDEDEAGAEVVQLKTSRAPTPADARHFGIVNNDEPVEDRLLDALTRLAEDRVAGGEKSPISQEKLQHIRRAREIRQAISSLQGPRAHLDANVAIRADIVKSMTDDQLAEEFHSSTPHDWSARPAFYTALINELEARRYFDFFKIPKEEKEEEPE